MRHNRQLCTHLVTLLKLVFQSWLGLSSYELLWLCKKRGKEKEEWQAQCTLRKCFEQKCCLSIEDIMCVKYTGTNTYRTYVQKPFPKREVCE